MAPTLTETLLSPTENTTFNDGRIFVSGRAEDDQAMQPVQVSIIDSAARYMSSSGAFPSTNKQLAHGVPDQPGNAGVELLLHHAGGAPGCLHGAIQGIDNHDQATTPPAVRHVTVTHPPGNTAPVANFTFTCPAPGQPATATNSASSTVAPRPTRTPPR